MKKVVTIALVLAMILSLSCSAFAVSIDTVEGGNLSSWRLDSRVADYVEAKIAADGEDLTVSQVKTITDFAGNEYKLVECSPCGYFIILAESGIITEYSYLATSPYAGLTGDLRYAGPTYYYVNSGSSDNMMGTINMQQTAVEAEYSHTVLTEEITITDAIVDRCVEINDEYNAAVVAEVRDYLAGTSTKADMEAYVNRTAYSANEIIGEGGGAGVDVAWFRNLTNNFGYVEGPNKEGCCGYVAANLILKYWSNDIKAFSLPTNHKTIDSTALTNELISEGAKLGYSYDTWALSIACVIDLYLDDYNIIGSTTWALGSSEVKDEINAYRPAILFGTLYNPQSKKNTNANHAVVAYHYTVSGSNTYYECHYGWKDYSSVNVWTGNSIMASNTGYNPYG